MKKKTMKTMIRCILPVFITLIFFGSGAVFAASDSEAKKDQAIEAKELSGMSIVGNDEAPKSLYIVPWKSSELSVETRLDKMSTEVDAPVDKDVFKRQLEFYKVSTE